MAQCLWMSSSVNHQLTDGADSIFPKERSPVREVRWQPVELAGRSVTVSGCPPSAAPVVTRLVTQRSLRPHWETTAPVDRIEQVSRAVEAVGVEAVVSDTDAGAPVRISLRIEPELISYLLREAVRVVAFVKDAGPSGTGSTTWTAVLAARRQQGMSVARGLPSWSPSCDAGAPRSSMSVAYRVPRRSRVRGSPSVSRRMNSSSAFHSSTTSLRAATGRRRPASRSSQSGSRPRRARISSLSMSVTAAHANEATKRDTTVAHVRQTTHAKPPSGRRTPNRGPVATLARSWRPARTSQPQHHWE